MDVAGTQLARHPEVVLPAIDYGDEPSIYDVHVLVHPESELERRLAPAIRSGKPESIKEARITGHHMVKGRGQLMPRALIERRQH